MFADSSFSGNDINEGLKEVAGAVWDKTKSAAKKTWNYTAAKVGRATKHATIGRKHNSLAFMRFACELDDGKTHKYVFTFNYKKARWYLLNDGMDMFNASSAMPSYEEVATFLKSSTCTKFIRACQGYILPYLKDTSAIDKMLYAFQHAGGNVVNLLEFIKKNKDAISTNMFDKNAIADMMLSAK